MLFIIASEGRDWKQMEKVDWGEEGRKEEVRRRKKRGDEGGGDEEGEGRWRGRRERKGELRWYGGEVEEE